MNLPIPYGLSAVCVCVATTLGVAPCTARAAETPACKALEPTTPEHARGRELGRGAVKKFKGGKLRQALEQFRSAYALYPHHQVLKNIGVIQRQLKQYCPALETFQRLREEVCTRKEIRETDLAVDELKRLCSATTEQVTVVSEPSGAKVWIDTESGDPAGITPWKGQLEFGSHFVLLRFDGYQDRQEPFAVGQGKPEAFQLSLEPAAPPEVVIVSQPTGALVWIDGEDGDPAGVTPWLGRLEPGSHFVLLRKAGHPDKRVSFIVEAGKSVSLQETLEAEPNEVTPPEQKNGSESPDDTESMVPVMGWTATGVGGAGLMAGAAFTLMTIGAADEAERMRRDASSDTSITLREIRSKEDEAGGYETASYIAYGVGGVLFATGVTLLVIDRYDADGEADDPMVSLWVTPASVTLTFRF